MTFYNVAFNGPVYASIGAFCQDVNVDSLMEFPQLYRFLIQSKQKIKIENKIFNIRSFIKYVLFGFAESFVITALTFLTFYFSKDLLAKDGTSQGLYMMGKLNN